MTVFLIGVTVALNRLRGWESGIEKWHGKYPCALLMGAVWGGCYWDAAIGLIVMAGYALWAAFGWGDYMDFSSNPNHEVSQIDQMFDRFAQPWRDGFSMAVRGLFIWPMFAAVGIYLQTILPLLIGLAMVLQGLFYWAGHRLWPDVSGRATRFSEWMCGAWMGVLLWLAMG